MFWVETVGVPGSGVEKEKAGRVTTSCKGRCPLGLLVSEGSWGAEAGTPTGGQGCYAISSSPLPLRISSLKAEAET